MVLPWVRDHVLAGREVLSLELEPGREAALPGPCSLAVVLSGEAGMAGEALAAGTAVVAPGTKIEAGPGGCRLGAVRWDAPPPRGEVRLESTASRHFEKYESFQAQVFARDGARDLLEPWEFYRVRMIAAVTERVQLHVHHVVTNLLFVPGDPGSVRGYLILSRDGRVTATPLLGGDRALVRPGLDHHVVPPPDGDPVEMLVLNDASSAYEHVDRSDFHLVESVPWSEVVVLPRPDRRPRLHAVE